MNVSLLLSSAAAVVGFAAAVFFCVGSATNSVANIRLQATPFWDFSEPIAQALAAQRAQYIVGAVVLTISFVLQVASFIAPVDIRANLPPWMENLYSLMLLILLSVLFSGWVSVRFIYFLTMREILRSQP